MGKTCEKTCILYCKASQRDAKEILSPGSLIKNHYHGKCFNLQLHLAANNKKITIFFFHVPGNLKVDSDIRPGASYLSAPPPLSSCCHLWSQYGWSTSSIAHKFQVGGK